MRVLIPFLVFVVFAAPLRLEAQTIAAGKMIGVRLERAVTTKSAGVGDAVTARVPESLKDGNGVVVPAGSLLQGRVDFVQRKSVTEDGWMRLLFDRVELPDGRAISTLAFGSFAMEKPKGKRDRLLAIGGFATAGALLGGRAKRVAAGLGGAILGLVLFENKHRYGRDLTLRAGSTIQLRLGGDLTAPSQ